MRRLEILSLYLFIVLNVAWGGAQNYNTWELLPLYGASLKTGDLVPGRPDSLVIISNNDAFYSVNKGIEWQKFSGSFSAPLQAFLTTDYPDSIYVNNLFSLLFSGDFGQTWTEIYYPTDQYMGDMAISNSKTSTIYGAVSFGDKIYKSVDKALNWQVILDRPGKSLQSLQVSQQDYRLVYVSYRDSIFKSINGGATWQNITNNYFNIGGSFYSTIFVSPYDDQFIIVTPSSGSNVFFSTNGGTSWQASALPVFVSDFHEVTFYPDNQTVYLPTAKNGIFYSQDRGVTWLLMGDNGLSNKNIRKVLVDPDDQNLVYALSDGNGVFKTTDNGQNWIIYSQGMYGMEISRVIESPTNADFILAGSNKGGISRTINGGKNWSIVNLGLTDLAIKDLIWPSSTSNKIGALTENDGFFLSENNGSSWQSAQNGATLPAYNALAFDSVSGRIYACGRASGSGSPIIYTDDWGQNWRELAVPSNFPYMVNDIAYNTLNSALYAATTEEVYRFDGVNWVNLSGTFFTDEQNTPKRIILHPSTIDTIYVAAGYNFMYMGSNGGTVWKQIFPYGGGQELLIDHKNPNILYIIGNNTEKSYDSGASWTYIYNKNVLPWLNCIGGDLSRNDNNILYYKTRSGIYRMRQAAELYTYSPDAVQTNVGSTKSVDIIVKNTGNSTLNISAVHFEGLHKSQWTILGLPSQALSILPQKLDTLQVKFHPDSVGRLNANLSGTTNDPLSAAMHIDLSGTGIGPLLNLPFTSLNYHNQYVKTAKDSIIKISNTGNKTLTVSSAGLSGNGVSAYSIAEGNAPFTVEPGQSHNLTLRFMPGDKGLFPATLSLMSDDVYQTVKSITLMGKGIAADIDLAGTSGLNFGTVYLGNYGDLNFQIKNIGDADLIITKITSSDSAFKITGLNLPASIPSNQSLQAGVRFKPSEVKQYSGVLKIYSNDPDENPFYLNLSGTCSNVPTGILTLSQNEQNFGDVEIGSTSPIWELAVSNSSSLYDFQIDSITVSNPAFIITESLAFPYQVNPGFTFPLHISFKPDTVKNYQGLITFYSNSSNGTQQVNLSGNGTAKPTGTLELSTTSMDFGKVNVYTNSDTMQIALSNSHSSYALAIDSIKIADAAFDLVGQDTIHFPIVLQSLAVRNLKVVFNPDAEKIYNSNLQIYSNASNGRLQTVALTGEGVQPAGTIAVSNDSIPFGNILVNEQSDPQTLTITNTSSTNAIHLDSLKLNSATFAYVFTPTLPYTLNPQQQVTVQLTFTPNDSGVFKGDLYVYSDASNNNLLRITLLGSGKYPQPPQITFNAGTVSASIGNTAGISLSLNSDLPITYARLFYRAGGKTVWDSTALSNTEGSAYTGQVPKNIVTLNGVVYYFKISDGRNTVRYPAQGALNLPVKVTNKEQSIVGGGTYQMISIPMQLNDASPLSVLGDNLGEYNIYKWRLFRWINGEYAELNDQGKNIGDFAPGAAFWLAAKSATSFNTGSGESVPVADSIVIALQNGWNQIADPFAFAVSWASVKAQGSVATDLWLYDSESKSFKQATTLQPWQGYFVKALENNCKLIVYPLESGIAPKIAKTSSSEGWRMQITARTQTAADAENFVGMAGNASDEYDRNDHFEPPAIGDYVSLYFPHPNWAISGSYSSDIRRLNTEGGLWNFTVSNSTPSVKIKLLFNLNNPNLEGKEIWLYDKKAGIPVDVRLKSCYQFQSSEKPTPRRFRILVGTSDYINNQFAALEIYPSRLTLYPNFPNPFNPETMIKFALPNDEAVWLTIYNVLGNKVRSLCSGKTLGKGYHAFLWNARNERGIRQASGIYFAVLRTTKQRRVMKMILVK